MQAIRHLLPGIDMMRLTLTVCICTLPLKVVQAYRVKRVLLDGLSRNSIKGMVVQETHRGSHAFRAFIENPLPNIREGLPS